MDPVDLKGRAALFKKIAQVAGEITTVIRDSENTQLRYKYASPSAIMSAVKQPLAKHNLAVVPRLDDVQKEDVGTKTQSGAPNVMTTVFMTFLILDGETGECLELPWRGEGIDWSDKGTAKAMTIAVRTFFVNAFQIPSDDEETDPDQHQPHSGGGYRSAPKKGPTPPRQPAQPAQAKPRAVNEQTGEIVDVPPPDPESERIAELRSKIKAEGKRLELRGDDWRNVIAKLTRSEEHPESAPGISDLTYALSTLQTWKDSADVSAWMDRQRAASATVEEPQEAEVA